MRYYSKLQGSHKHTHACTNIYTVYKHMYTHNLSCTVSCCLAVSAPAAHLLTCNLCSCLLSLFLSLSVSHTHTLTHSMICVPKTLFTVRFIFLTPGVQRSTVGSDVVLCLLSQDRSLDDYCISRLAARLAAVSSPRLSPSTSPPVATNARTLA